MKKYRGFIIPLALAVVLAGAPASRGAKLFDKAAPLKVAHWVKDGPVTLTPGHVYVVEFWATWCPPCRESIPHLTELAKKYQGRITFIGISDEALDIVKSFVEKMGDKMDYHVAVDDKQATTKGYMAAYGIDTIPHAFIVDKNGNVAWQGNPLEGLEPVLEQVLAGKLDKETAVKKEKMNELAMQYLRLAMGGEQQKAQADPLGRQLLELGNADPMLLSNFAWTIVKAPALKYRDRDLSVEAAKKAFDLTKGQDPLITGIYAGVLHEMGRDSEAIPLQKKAIALATDARMKSYLQNVLAEMEKTTGRADTPTTGSKQVGGAVK
ncbi:MAG: redoxin family protein [bacterium]|nr:redoxin family protein [bacterium]